MQELQTDNIGNIIEPEPIGFSLDAPGWYALAALLILILLIYAFYAVRKYYRNQYRRDALSAFELLKVANMDQGAIIFNLLEIMKRVALTSYGRAEVAALQGTSWIQFLDNKNGGKPVFSDSSHKIISTSLYQGSKANVEDQLLENFYQECANWIRTHRV